MAIIDLKLPKCDVCGEVWLPQKGLGRDEPRRYDAAQRTKGVIGLRCGKCKSPRWDREFTGDRRRKNPGGTTSTLSENTSPPAAKPIPNGSGLEALYGLLEEEFKALGGGEAFLKAERAAWGPDPWDKIAMAEKSHGESEQ